MGIYNNHLSTAANAGPVWVTGTNYQVGDFVTYNNTAYLCLAAHAAAASFLTDLSADRWRQIGQEQVNYIATNSGDLTVGWTPYADAAGAQPVDGTGGSPTITWGSTPTTPLRGRNSFLLTKTNVNSQGQGVSYSFTIDRADSTGGIGPAVQQISFDYEIASGIYGYGTSSTDSDLTLYIIADPTGTPTVIQPAGYKIDGGRVRATFQPLKTTSSYRLCLHIATTSASAWTMQLDNFSVGPQVRSYGPAMSDWVSYTPTGSWTTNTTYSGRWKRVGDSAQFFIKATLSGAPNSATFTVNLPSGMVIDSSKIVTSVSTGEALGAAAISDAGTRGYLGTVAYNNTTSVRVLQPNSGNAGGVDQANPIVFGTGDEVALEFQVPIVGWSSNTLISDSADTRVVSLAVAPSTGSGTIGAAFNDVTFAGTILKDTHGAFNGTTYTVKVPGDYWVSAGLEYNHSSVSVGTTMAVAVYRNGSSINSAPIKATSTSVVNYNPVISTIVSNCKVGDTITIRSWSNGTSPSLSASFGGNYVNISMVSGPSQIAASEVIAAKATWSGSQTITTSSATLQYDAKVFDTHNAITGLNSSAFKFTCPAPGIYKVSAGFLSASTTTVGQAIGIVFVKGVGSVQENRGVGVISGSARLTGSAECLVQCVTGDTLTAQLATTTGTVAVDTGSVFNYVAFERIGGII